MDGELFRELYHRCCSDPNLNPTRDCTNPDSIILLICFFAALNNCSPRWAHNKRNWPLWCRHLKCPSYAQLMKRLALKRTDAPIDQINAEFRGRLPVTREKVCDGKPLVKRARQPLDQSEDHVVPSSPCPLPSGRPGGVNEKRC